MLMKYYIEKVHYDENYKGNEVIARLRYSLIDGVTLYECSKREMIAKINNGNTACTWVNGKMGDNVHVVDNSYLRTDGNNKLSDNLGNLPQF